MNDLVDQAELKRLQEQLRHLQGAGVSLLPHDPIVREMEGRA